MLLSSKGYICLPHFQARLFANANANRRLEHGRKNLKRLAVIRVLSLETVPDPQRRRVVAAVGGSLGRGLVQDLPVGPTLRIFSVIQSPPFLIASEMAFFFKNVTG